MAEINNRQVDEVMAWLKAHVTQNDIDNLQRFGINAPNALGVSMANIQKLAKELGRDHALALDLWKTGCHEARMLTAYVDDPKLVTPAQMDRWCRDFDNWAIVDTLCFALWDRTPHAWGKVMRWSKKKDEFGKRAAFALLACLAAHDKRAPDEAFLERLPLIEQAATDDRNFVKKGVSWALRMTGRRNANLKAACLALARTLAQSDNPATRWIGRDAVRDLTKAKEKKQA